MNGELTFTTKTLRAGNFGCASSVPDILSAENPLDKTEFQLDEKDEIYEGYGKIANVYPYRQKNSYTRQLQEIKVKIAVLENSYMRAEFLTEYGGRLWTLFDKTKNRNLVYTNDVLRPSNLSVRNAWFSGGVEWNIGVIGHAPRTCEPLFCAKVETDFGTPVLRMYEYERIRGVTRQMDFWLAPTEPKLFCAMRIVNSNESVVPMYWWSNIAVPEYKNGRVLVPAQSAFTSNGKCVTKTAIPYVNGVDVSRYCEIPGQVDYFFDIPDESPKFIANVDAEGNGLLHTSTARLRSRKLFSWGNNEGSARWQEFLTNRAGRYLEIQAGIGKTQYGCIPMAPHTAWEWVETYEPLTLNHAEQEADFAAASASVTARVKAELPSLYSAQALARSFAKKAATVVQHGSGDAALALALNATKGEAPFEPHLDFSCEDQRTAQWHSFLQTGHLAIPENGVPNYDICGADWMRLLQNAVAGVEKDNWYAHYHLGLVYWDENFFAGARRELAIALRLDKNAFTLHGLAVLNVREGHYAQAIELIKEGVCLRPNDLSYVKDTLRVLKYANAWDELLAIVENLPQEIRADARIKLDCAEALYHTGNPAAAWEILTDGEGLEVPDLKEGEESIGTLWKNLNKALTGEENAPVPHHFNFDAFAK